MIADADDEAWPFGIEPTSVAAIRRLCESSKGLERLWIFGSRARGDHRPRSDIDLAVEAPGWTAQRFSAFEDQLRQLPMVYPVDAVRWDDRLPADFRSRIERDRKPLWEPRRWPVDVETVGNISLKRFQSRVLTQVGVYLDALKSHRSRAEAATAALKDLPDMESTLRDIGDFPKKAWIQLAANGSLPVGIEQGYSSRFDGAGRAIPNVCLKVPTGGGKTLLAAATVAKVFSSYLNRHTGLVLWVVPNDAIYRQTLKALADRDHPYRQILNVAGAGRVKLLEKGSPLTRLDVDSHLCVMVLMLQSAARHSKETLKFFRDRGNVLGFLPREDDYPAHHELLQQVPNLDAYSQFGATAAEARAQYGSIVKSSLGNVMRLIRPMVVIDEGHHAYTENALSTLDGFNPSFLLELSATPRAVSMKGGGSNILVNVSGSDLDDAEMIKLPIKVDVRAWNDWQTCLSASVKQLDQLREEAAILRAETARYIRPILLVQVERTGAEMRDSGYIHAEDAKTWLLQLGFNERQIAIKTSEKDDLKQPENIDLLASNCELRVIITKQALQEGWDCPFAYVLCALAAGRNLSAMTQLVGRILRLPHTAKTGRPALDACYVFCHDAKTSDVVKNIKKSLESEGLGDLTLSMADGSTGETATHTVRQTRRPAFAKLRLFVPRVSWAEPDAARRELVYDSDILSRLPWASFNTAALATDWAPDARTTTAQQFEIGLNNRVLEVAAEYRSSGIDPARLVRGLIDLAPNAWLLWDWVGAVLADLQARGYSRSDIGRSSNSLLERLRIGVEAERDRLAQTVFEQLVADGCIEFQLRADATDYELPQELQLALMAKPQALIRDDARPIEKSLLEPAIRTPDVNNFEAAFAGYLDQKAALRWWHRNVAKTQYGLQGWKRNKVYPDFVFAYVTEDGTQRTVLMETKGLQLQGSTDTLYKQALLRSLSEAFRDARHEKVGEMMLEGGQAEDVVCDLVFDEAWQGRLGACYFSKSHD